MLADDGNSICLCWLMQVDPVPIVDGREGVVFAVGTVAQVQSRDAAVDNVREGLPPAQLQEQLGAHASTRQHGDGDLQERKGQGQDAQALGSEVAAPVAEPGEQVLVGDKGLGSPARGPRGRKAEGTAKSRHSIIRARGSFGFVNRTG